MRYCSVCGRALRVTEGDIGPVCSRRNKYRTAKVKPRVSKKAYLRLVKRKDIFVDGQRKG